MAKKGTFNGPFFSSFPVRIHGTPIRFGLLIGSEAEDERLRDVISAAATPPKPGEDGEPSPQPKDIVALAKSKAAADFASWARTHAEAVRKLLPGGLEPCGCFAVVPDSDAKEIAPLLAPILKDIVEPLVLTIDEKTRKTSFWQYSATAKPPMRPATMKADPHKEALLLWCSAPVDALLPRGAELLGGDAAADASQEALQGVAQVLDECKMALEAPGVPMTLVDMGSEATVGKIVPNDCSELRISFLRGGAGAVAAPNPEENDCMRQRCLVVGTAVLLRRTEEFRKAATLLRKSVVASVGHRLQLALEEAEDGPVGRLQLPWKALLKPEGLELPFWCGDYCMPDEDFPAARERLGQLLGMPEAAFEAPPAHLDEKKILAQKYPGTYGPPEKAESPSKKASGGMALPAAGCVLAIGVVLVAAVAPMLLK